MFHLFLAAGLLERLAEVPVAYLLLWCSLAAISLVLVSLARTRWARNRPLHRCAVLSLLVHLVFACLAMTVRVVVGEGGGHGTGPPIRVRILDEAPQVAVLAPTSLDVVDEMDPPALLEPPPLEPPPASAAELKSGETELIDDEAVKNLDTQSEPHLRADATADAPPRDVIAEGTTNQLQSEPSVNDVSPPVTQNLTNPPPRDEIASQPATADDAGAGPARPPVDPSAAAAAPPATYALRAAPGRLGWIEAQGGNVRTEAAVTAALQWLATAQSPDGHWDADRFGAGRELAVLGHNRYGAGREADTGISALALLAFLGAGHTHRAGDYQLAVRRGIDFLIHSQAPDGSIFGNAEIYAQMYCHSMATFALAESAAMTRDAQLIPSVERAVAFCLRAQNPSTGGWRYRPGDTGDTSQLGWQMMALASAKRAGIPVPQHTWTGIERFLRSVRRGNHGGLASYRPDSPATTSMTAEALYCWLLLTETLGSPSDERAAAEATAQLLAAPPTADRVNLYYWYYATLALHHRQQLSDQAAAGWHAWNDALTAVLLNTQVSTGRDAGSWDPECLWGGYGGRVYSTAISAMCLEVYYRYAPAPPRGGWIASRPEEREASH